jgi:hypothetical protein
MSSAMGEFNPLWVTLPFSRIGTGEGVTSCHGNASDMAVMSNDRPEGSALGLHTFP